MFDTTKRDGASKTAEPRPQLDPPDSWPLFHASRDSPVQRHALMGVVNVVVPPPVTAVVSRQRPRSNLRDRTIQMAKQIRRRRCKKESGYHQQARMENTFFRYKSIIGGRLRARHSRAQDAEALIACDILNRMAELGRPASFAIRP